MEDVEGTTLVKLSPFQLPDSTTKAQRIPLKSSSIATIATAAVLAKANFIDVDVQNLLLDKLTSSGRSLGLSMQFLDTMAQHQDREKLSELIGKLTNEKGTIESRCIQGDDTDVDVDDSSHPDNSDDSRPHEVEALSRVPISDESRLDPNNMVRK